MNKKQAALRRQRSTGDVFVRLANTSTFASAARRKRAVEGQDGVSSSIMYRNIFFRRVLSEASLLTLSTIATDDVTNKVTTEYNKTDTKKKNKNTRTAAFRTVTEEELSRHNSSQSRRSSIHNDNQAKGKVNP